MREIADQRTKKWRMKVEDKGVRILIIMCDMLVIITLKKIYPKNKKNIENTVDRRVTDDGIRPLSFLLIIP